MKFLQKLSDLFTLRKALDFVYPMKCSICEKDGTDSVCQDCASRLPRVDFPYCVRCGKPLSQKYRLDSCKNCAESWKYIDRARSLFLYQSPALELLHKFKYNGRISLGVFLAKSLAEAFPSMRSLSTLFSWEPVEEPIVIIPIPIHPVKKFTRGFNQNEVVLEFYRHALGIPVSTLMIRRKYTRSQVGLTENKRFENVKHAFYVPKRLSRQVEGKSVLLFDDLITTGATINSAGRALKKAGARYVFALSLYTAVKS